MALLPFLQTPTIPLYLFSRQQSCSPFLGRQSSVSELRSSAQLCCQSDPKKKKKKVRSFDRDPEFAEIMGACLDDPQKARSKMKERLRKKRNKILHTKSGSEEPMKVVFNDFGFSNSYIWFESYNTPLEQDVTLLSDLSQSPFDKRPNYDAIQGANVTPTTFYNIGDLEIQDNLGRVWADIGTKEPLILDILINALTQISSDFVGIKQVVFGGTEFEHWNEKLTSEEAGYAVHKI